MGRVASPPREVGPALPGRRVAPASAASLSSSARPSPPLAPHRARGGVALPVEDHGGPAATATGLPPVSSYVPTPLAEAASAHLSPPPTTDPKPPLGPSGFGLPARRRARYRIAATPLPQLLLPDTPASDGPVPGPPRLRVGRSGDGHAGGGGGGGGRGGGYSGGTRGRNAWCGGEPLGRPLSCTC